MEQLSIGCRSCHLGNWLCIFLTYLCNAKCDFCPAPFSQEDKIITAFGSNPDVILQYVNQYGFTGISFSGGECFLVFDRLVQWLRFFKESRPDVYFWAYTNGIDVTDDQMTVLAGIGLNELRFNIAATGYTHPDVIRVIREACKRFEHVAVEIPSIPGDFLRLTQALTVLKTAPIHFLNLHEYILTPHDPVSTHARKEIFLLNKQSKIPFDLDSASNTRKIMAFCRDHDLGMKINDCSLKVKEKQMLQRRLKMGQIVRKDFEELTPDGLLETYYVSSMKENIEELENSLKKGKDLSSLWEYCHHENEINRLDLNRKTVFRLQFLPPMFISDRRILHRAEMIVPGEE